MKRSTGPREPRVPIGIKNSLREDLPHPVVDSTIGGVGHMGEDITEGMTDIPKVMGRVLIHRNLD